METNTVIVVEVVLGIKMANDNEKKQQQKQPKKPNKIMKTHPCAHMQTHMTHRQSDFLAAVVVEM